ncbi:hypothetical protein FGO85_03255 [Ligilactobacillus salivarius]|uniref:hypothetical protein n=1 Tax=Ligilactobacillus salivarius TaxID=1624 RepID=UPI0011CB77C5|nr:hypothetical protein [Ligilactobacillus salivarius]MDY5290961.1 hypothetical protein [Ligilactobacillus salivarius]TXJ77690.1 hypothetical protein FGO85_03255 [Ligilactobacillus salivarius]
MTDGWHIVDGSWYYFHYDGRMASNEFIDDYQNRSYKIDGSGHYVKNQWIRVNNNTWNYAGKDGILIKNTWAKIGGVWYYFNQGGKMASNELIQDENGNYYY